MQNGDFSYLTAYESDWKNRFSANYNRSKNTQKRFFKYSQNNVITDFVLLISKFISDKRAIQPLSGEYGLEKNETI